MDYNIYSNNVLPITTVFTKTASLDAGVFVLITLQKRELFSKNAFIFRIFRFFAARDVLKTCILKAYRYLENVY